MFCHCPGPGIYKPINLFLFTNAPLLDTDSQIAVIPIIQMGMLKNTTDIGLLCFQKSQISSKCRFSRETFEMSGICWKHSRSLQGDSAWQMLGVREKLSQMGSYDHSLTSTSLNDQLCLQRKPPMSWEIEDSKFWKCDSHTTQLPFAKRILSYTTRKEKAFFFSWSEKGYYEAQSIWIGQKKGRDMGKQVSLQVTAISGSVWPVD